MAAILARTNRINYWLYKQVTFLILDFRMRCSYVRCFSCKTYQTFPVVSCTQLFVFLHKGSKVNFSVQDLMVQIFRFLICLIHSLCKIIIRYYETKQVIKKIFVIIVIRCISDKVSMSIHTQNPLEKIEWGIQLGHFLFLPVKLIQLLLSSS